jgi:hypothetical protein
MGAAVSSGAPAFAFACLANALMGAAVVQAMPIRRRVVLAGAAAAVVVFSGWLDLFAWGTPKGKAKLTASVQRFDLTTAALAARYLFLGAVCGLTGRWAGRRWGCPPLAVTAVALVCGGCAVLTVAVLSQPAGLWGLPGSLVAASVGFVTASILGGGCQARAVGSARGDPSNS